MKRATRRTLAVVAMFVLLIAGAVALLNFLGSSRLERCKARLRAQGGKLTLAELFTNAPAAPPGDFSVFQLAGSRLPNRPVQGGSMNAMVFAAPGRATALVDGSELVHHGGTTTWDELSAQVKSGEDDFATVRAWLRTVPLESGFDWRLLTPGNYPGGPFILQRQTAQALSVATIEAAHRRDIPRVVENLEAMFALARLYETNCSLVDVMIRVAVAGLAGATSWEALQAEGWNDDHLRRLQEAATAVHFPAQMVRTVEFERALGGTYFQWARTDPQVLRMMQTSWWLTNAFVGPLDQGLYRVAWLAEDELAYLEEMEKIHALARSAARAKSYAVVAAALQDREAAAREKFSGPLAAWRLRMSGSLFPNYTRAFRALLRQETTRSLLLADLGTRRFQIAHGRLPDSLEELVPKFLAEVPVDFMDGRPIRYRVENGRPVFYSVGDNGVDDGGNGIPLEPWNGEFSHRDGHDVIWPVATRGVMPAVLAGEVCPLIVIDAVPFGDAMRNLERQGGFTVKFSPEAAWWVTNGVPVSSRLENSTATAMLSNIVFQVGLKLHRVPGTNVFGLGR
jgi:hypothetical protein